ncbi:MAG: ABC transporter ATP-binding protein [Rubrivivax sp.]|nr:ABC transporter ATP-binding protein [Rubrivivax sp.]
MSTPEPPTPALLRVQGLGKRFGETPVFDAVDLALGAGEFVALVGESGVGKSTLLNCIAGLEAPDTGQVWLQGEAITQLPEEARARVRREALGFVFQAFHVLPHLTVEQNVELPLRLQGRPDAQRVAGVLDAVGLHGLGRRHPAQLSGGQLQRVAIARAVVHQPRLILADEPTGNLDPATAEKVLDVLLACTRRSGAACLLVTHAEGAARRADRVLRLTPRGVETAG